MVYPTLVEKTAPPTTSIFDIFTYRPKLGKLSYPFRKKDLLKDEGFDR